MTDYFKEPLPPGVKNLDNYEIDFPEHNLADYVMYSPKGVKQSDTNYDKDIQVDNVFIERMKIMAEHENQYFKQEVSDDMLPDWMKDKEPMYNTNPEDWTNYDSDDLPLSWE
jgi:hypothetical protein